MGAWAYCTNEDCQRGFARPSFAEIIARKRKCPACGQINHVGDDLGKALDEKFEEIAELLTAGSQLVAVADDELPGLWQTSDLSGGATDCNVAAGTIVPPPVSFVPGEAPRKTASHVNAKNLASIIAALRCTTGTETGRYSVTSANASNKPQSVAAGQEANTAPQLVGTLTYSVGGIVELRLADGGELPPGYYTISLTKEH